MTLRRMLLGLVGVVAMESAVTAKPPLEEGREVDPVVREFQLGEPPIAIESGTPPLPPDRPGDVFGWSIVVALHEAIMNHFTMPLGTVTIDEVH